MGLSEPLPTTSLIIVQPSPFCNIDCGYCYLPDRANRVRMSEARMTELFANVLSFPTLQDQVTVVWHAGEPLVLGIDYYEAVFSSIAATKPKHLKVDHSFQTNGILLSDAWCELIKKWGVSVGLSIDGPAHIHDAYRKTRSGAGTFSKAVKAIQTLRKHDIGFNVISVLTRDALVDPEAMFDFFHAHDIVDVAFNVDELEGANRESTLSDARSENLMSDFLHRFSEKMRSTGFEMRIRELEEMVNSVRYLHPEGPINNLATPFGIVTIDVLGDVYTFSPELAGFAASDYSTFAIGNIFTDSFEDMQNSPALAKLSEDIDRGIDLCRQSCAYYTVCGGGAPSNKIFENKTFASTHTMHCKLTKMVVADFVMSVIENRPSASFR